MKNKIKVALCIIGQYRQFDYTFPLWNVDDNVDVDYFVSTWDTSRELKKYIYNDINIAEFKNEYPYGLVLNYKKIDFFQKITESKIKKSLPTAKIKIYNSKYTSNNNTTNMIFLMKSCIDMLDTEQYDYIAIVRFDSVVNIKNNICELEKDILYHSGWYSMGEPLDDLTSFSINDTHWAGGSDLIKKFVNGIYPTIYIPHSHLAYYIYENNFNQLDLNKGIYVSQPHKPATIPFLKKFIKEQRNPFENNNVFLENEREAMVLQTRCGAESIN
jgi:hypothetical protein